MSAKYRGIAAALALVPIDGMLLVGPGVPSGALPEAVPYRRVPPGSLISLAEGAAMTGRRGVVALGTAEDVYGAMLGALLHAVSRNLTLVCAVLQTESETYVGPAAYDMEPLRLVKGAGATFLAQISALDRGAVMDTMQEALAHDGFALVSVLMDDRVRPPIALGAQVSRPAGWSLPALSLTASVSWSELLGVGRGH